MGEGKNGMKVSIMGREFSVACDEDQQAALNEAAIHLDRKMREIQKSGRIIGIERCAIMAALNITHELLDQQKRNEEYTNIGGRLRALQEKIDLAMQEQKQLSL